MNIDERDEELDKKSLKDDSSLESERKEQITGIVNLYKALREASIGEPEKAIDTLEQTIKNDSKLPEKDKEQTIKQVRTIDERFENLLKVQNLVSGKRVDEERAKKYFDDIGEK